MRKNYFLLFVAFLFAISITNRVSAQYCTTALYTTGCTDPDNVESFSTTGGITNITNNNTGCSNTATAYTYFNTQTHTALPGSTVNFSFTNGPTFTEYYKIWVDFNNNGILDDAGELVYTNPVKIAANEVVTGSFVIPVSTAPGTKRLRIREVYSNNTFTPCSQETWGEVEDYNLVVQPSGPCTNPPTAGSVTSSVNPACSGASFSLGINGGTFGTGQTYRWQSSPSGAAGSWTDIPGATSTNVTLTQTAPTYYRYLVTCGVEVASNPLLVGSIICYCPSSANNTADEEIVSVKINGATNVGPCGVLAPGPGSIISRYSNFYPLGALTTLIPGYTTDFIIQEDECEVGTFFSNGCAIFIDFNQDGDFDDAGERVFAETTTTQSPRTITGNITVPAGATPGITGLRIIVQEGAAGTAINPCGTYGYGETEDYLINIIPPTPCSAAPNPGTATAFPTTACLGQTVNLQTSGVTLAVGQSYQWQTSPDNVTWTDAPGANSFVYSTTQVATTWYRFRAICDVTHDTAYTASVQVFTPPVLSGTYTIDKAVTGAANLYPNTRVFNSFNSAYDAAKCGITSSVIFNVAPGSGPYNEQLIMSGQIPNTSAARTITYVGNGNTITFAPTAAEPAVIKLRGIDWIRFDGLVINATGTTNAFGVHLTNDANNNIIRNCTVNIDATATGTGLAGIVISGSETSATGTGTTTAVNDFNQVLNNTINGGYYGMTLTATFSGGANGNNLFFGNDVKNFYGYGMYVSGSYNTTVDSNTFSRPTRTNTATTVRGIYFTSQSNSANVTRNRITNPFGAQLAATAAFNGIEFNASTASAANNNIVSNNLIFKTNGNGAIYGLYNTSSGNVWYLHNTISIDSLATATVASRGFAQGTSATGILFNNNLISITRGGPGNKHGIYLSALLFNCNYNNYYISSPGGSNYVGYYTTDRVDLPTWQNATGHDQNSYTSNPVFVNPNDPLVGYKPGNAAIDNKGFYIGITEDIIGVLRGGAPGSPAGSKPDIGAYEFIAPACSIPPINGTTQIIPAGPVCENSNIKLNLSIAPFGGGQSFQWQYANTATGPWTNVGPASSNPDTIINTATTRYYRAIVSCGSAIDSSNPVQIQVTPAMPAGTYTINKGATTTYVNTAPVSGTNFASFADVRTSIQSCGILGSVVFNVVPLSGPYNEQFKLDTIRGTSPTSTVTFNGNGNTIAFNVATPPTSAERAVIKLTRADFITFDSLRIDATGATFTYGYGVQLLNNADSNTFRNCTILANNTSTAANYAGVVINATDAGITATGATLTDGNIFDNNTINGGYYGATIVGNTSTNIQINNNIFRNNRIEDFYQAGFYIAGTYNTLIEGNMISRATRTAVANPSYGIYVTGTGSPVLKISKNRITNMLGGAPTNGAGVYGIYHLNADVPAGNENIVSNNIIYNLKGGGAQYGIANSGTDGVFYYHNTISLDDRGSAATLETRGFYQTTLAIDMEFINNIITITRGGTGSKHAIYLATTTSEVASSNNDLYVSAPGANNFIGFKNAVNYATLPAWQAGTSLDANSFAVDPTYTDSLTGNFAPGILTIDDKGIWKQIATDIVGTIRNPATPDIGAYEFTPPNCIDPPVAGTASVTPNSGICLEAPITLNLVGHSPLGTLTIQWQASPDGLTNWTDVGPLLYSPQLNTVTTQNTFFRAKLICGSGAPVYSNIVNVVLNNVVLAGTYTIDNSQPTTWPGPAPKNFNTFNEAVTAMSCGITGPVVFNVMPGTTAGVYTEQVRIPYIRNSSAINTITFQSNSGNPSSATLTTSATAANNYTLKLDGAKYITFRNMTLAGTNATYGRVVEIADTASYNRILNNNIQGVAVTVVNSNATGVFANALKGTGNVIKGNTVTNGSTGIYFWGTSAANLTVDNIIDSNTVSGFYGYGIYANFHKRATITRNTVNVSSPLSATSYGIYASDCDSSYQVSKNNVNIQNALTEVYGIYVNNSDSSSTKYGYINGNIVTATTGNTGNLYGMYINNSPGNRTTNNVIAVNTTSAVAYGLLTNSNFAYYHHNSINNTSPNGIAGTTNYAARFNNAFANPRISILNNIFSHNGGGISLFVDNTVQSRGSDYNMLYTSGTNLVRRGTPAATYATLDAWRTGTFWDKYSVVYAPAFKSNSDLRPEETNPDSWAIQGRAVQVKGDVADINGNYRPDSLTAGVPDLGAYEFFPSVLPPSLAPTPNVAPAPGLRQSFMFGTDTVMNLTWGATVPTTVGVRRFSGVVPPNPPYPGSDSMFFYTQVETPGTKKYDADVRLHYLDPWQGSIPDQWRLGLGRYTIGANWVVGFSSRVDATRKFITQQKLDYLDKFTGFINPYAPPVLPDKDTSNRGRNFWVSYPMNELDGGQDMVLYLSAEEPANVTVTINGTSWVRQYAVPAFSVTVTENIPKAGPDNAFLNAPGLFDQGIHIESDVPIVAYAHYIGSASSGAAVLIPVSTWGWEYKSLSMNTPGYSDAYSYVSVIADKDNSLVEITPTVPVQNPGFTPNVPTTVVLNRGQVFQLVSVSHLEELTGTVVKSLSNSAGVCLPVAVFSGNTRATLAGQGPGCGGSGGDFTMQQNFPMTAWGKRYLTAPSSASDNATALQPNKFRIAVRDPSTVVKKNGIVLTPLINNHYYEYFSTTPDYIEADKPVMVAQYLTGACQGVGDPEMMYISPHEQGIKNVSFYRNTRQSIQVNYLTLIIPSGGLPSLRITDGATVVTPDYVYDHPQSGLFGVPYKVVVKRWAAAQQQVRVESDSAFMGITYGLGSVESYGYNVGFFLKNLQAAGTFTNTLSTTGNTDFTCVGSPFTFNASLPIIPTSITFNLASVPNLSPNANVSIANPVPSQRILVGRDSVYIFQLTNTYSFSQPGIYRMPVTYSSPLVEGCNNTKTDTLFVQVVPSPKTNFSITYSGCEGDVAQFTGDAIADNGAPLNTYKWTFHDGSIANGSTSTFTYNTPGTYNVDLYTVTADGCVGDSIKQVLVNPRPVAAVVTDSIAVCPGGNATYNIQSPLAGATYKWYTVATGGTAITTGGNFTVGANGTSFAVTNVAATATYYVEGVSAAGCASYTRKAVKVQVLNPLAAAAPINSGSTANTVSFSWPAVTGASSYEVSVNGGPYITPSSGATGLTHTVTGVGVLQSVCIIVKANGSLACQSSMSASVCGCSNSSATVIIDSVAICTGSGATFNIQSPVAGFTYTWYTTATGGTALVTGGNYVINASGSQFTVNNVAGPAVYYVQQASGAGCTGSVRTRVKVEVLGPLTPAVVTAVSADITTTSITFRWLAVPGAGTYQVSTDNGVTWVTPSSGASGLSHTVSGLNPLQQACIKVRAIGIIACQTSESVSVCAVTKTDEIFIPNTFTPNGDGKNDQLIAFGWAIQSIQFMVFNQWGEKIHEVNTTAQNSGTGGFVIWDGKYKGKVQPVGVYVYAAKITLKDGTVIQKSGALNIVR